MSSDIIARWNKGPLRTFWLLSSRMSCPARKLTILNQRLQLYLHSAVSWAPPWWSGGVLSLKRPTLPADWCQSQACVDTRDQGEEEGVGRGGTLHAGSGAGGGTSSFSLVLESNEVKGVKVSGSRMRTCLIVWRSNLRSLRATLSQLCESGERLCVCVERNFERRDFIKKGFTEHRTSCYKNLIKFSPSRRKKALIWLASNASWNM